MKIYANAKINIGLYITGLDEKKYHLLDATMLPVNLFDEIEININFLDVDRVTFINQQVPLINTITKVLDLMRKELNFREYFDIKIVKNIPSGAGLGGGSSDAAFVMKAIIELLNLNYKIDKLLDIALKVGADVPFFLINKPCRMQGIGEVLTQFNITKDFNILLIKPKLSINTMEAYNIYDQINNFNESNINDIINSLQKGNIPSNVINDLWLSATIVAPKLVSIIKEINKYEPNLSTMSGSGSTIVVMDDNIEVLNKIKDEFIKKQEIELCEIVKIIK